MLCEPLTLKGNRPMFRRKTFGRRLPHAHPTRVIIPSDPAWVSIAITGVVFAGCSVIIVAFAFM